MRRLLVADDDAAQLRLALHIVRSLGFEVYSAADGVQALRQIREHRIQLAVLDWMMPELSGVDVCRELKNLPWLTHSIIVTAHGTTADLAPALEAGASDYVVKPFKPEELCARLQVGARILSLQERATQTQKLESIGQLAAGIAHEINTPAQFVGDNLRFLRDSVAGLLAAVGAQAELLGRLARGESLEAELLRQTLATVEELDFEYLRSEIPMAFAQSIDGVDRVAKIVGAMKQFSHPGVSDRIHVNLNEAIESTVTVSRGEWKLVAEVEVDLDPELPDVECAPGEINQVLLNLIVNAAHAIADVSSEREKGHIRIATRREETQVRISISDTGKGIPREIRERIFEPFFTTKEVGKGTGQGLAIAYEVVVRQHKGSIEFESEAGKGTTFTVRLPIAFPAADPQPTPS